LLIKLVGSAEPYDYPSFKIILPWRSILFELNIIELGFVASLFFVVVKDSYVSEFIVTLLRPKIISDSSDVIKEGPLPPK
jgi:hypothetical protein